MEENISKDSLIGILNKMIHYNRESGYVDYVEQEDGTEVLTFFDSDPKLKGVGAWYVTQEELKSIINLIEIL